MNWKRWTGSATFWKTLPNRSLLIFLAAVFCLFGSLGFIFDIMNPQATFGMTGIEEVVQRPKNKELRDISAELRARVLEYGEQRDDQTILLVRRLA